MIGLSTHPTQFRDPEGLGLFQSRCVTKWLAEYQLDERALLIESISGPMLVKVDSSSYRPKQDARIMWLLTPNLERGQSGE